MRRSEETTPRSLSIIFGSKLRSRMRSASMSNISSSAVRGNQSVYTVTSRDGVGVVAAAVLLHLDVELLGAVLLRAVEHHVLEEVRQAGCAGALVARADPEEEVQRDVGDVVVLLDQDLHAVGQGVGFYVELLAACQRAGQQ